MPAPKEVPKRGDGFDTAGTGSSSLPAKVEDGQPAVEGGIQSLGLAQVAATLGTEPNAERILKNLSVGTGGAIGAVAARELNEQLGGLIEDEWAAAAGAFFGALIGGTVSKNVRGSSTGKSKKYKRRRY